MKAWITCIVSCSATLCWGQASIRIIGAPTGPGGIVIGGISSDATTIVGSFEYGGPGFYWRNGAFHAIPIPASQQRISQVGCTPDGNTFWIRAGTNAEWERASYLSNPQGTLTQISAAGDPAVLGVTADGQTAYGHGGVKSGSGPWQPMPLYLAIGPLGYSAQALTTSDGRVVGVQNQQWGFWNLAAGFDPVLPNSWATPTAVSSSGSHIVGARGSAFGNMAYIWSANGEGQPLGFGESGSSIATGVSRNGEVVVGLQSMPIFGQDVFLWSQATGKVPLREYLASRGVSDVNDWVFISTFDNTTTPPWITPDGTKVVGVGYRQTPTGSSSGVWIADIGDPGAPLVSGRVLFRSLDASAVPPNQAVFEFRAIDTHEVIESMVSPVDIFGNFRVSAPRPNGAFNLSVKQSHWLRKSTDIDTALGDVSGLLLRLTNGDVDGDNEVGIGDYAQLSAAYGSENGGPGWDANADLNGDEVVDIADFAILSENYGQVGD